MYSRGRPRWWSTAPVLDATPVQVWIFPFRFSFYFCESNIRHCKVRSQIIFIYINSHLTYMIFIYSVKTEKKISHSPGKKKRRKELITRCLSQCSESILNVHISNAPLNTRYWTYRDARGMCQWDVVLLLLVTSRNSCQPERSQICIFMFTSSVAHLVFTITIQMHLRDTFYFA